MCQFSFYRFVSPCHPHFRCCLHASVLAGASHWSGSRYPVEIKRSDQRDNTVCQINSVWWSAITRQEVCWKEAIGRKGFFTRTHAHMCMHMYANTHARTHTYTHHHQSFLHTFHCNNFFCFSNLIERTLLNDSILCFTETFLGFLNGAVPNVMFG